MRFRYLSLVITWLLIGCSNTGAQVTTTVISVPTTKAAPESQFRGNPKFCNHVKSLISLDFRTIQTGDTHLVEGLLRRDAAINSAITDIKSQNSNKTVQITLDNGDVLIGSYEVVDVPILVAIPNTQTRVSLREVIACLGNPSSYLAMAPRDNHDNTVGASLTVFYPDNGIEVWVSELGKDIKGYASDEFMEYPVLRISRVANGTAQQIQQRIYASRGIAKVPEQRVQNIRTWPSPATSLTPLTE